MCLSFVAIRFVRFHEADGTQPHEDRHKAPTLPPIRPLSLQRWDGGSVHSSIRLAKFIRTWTQGTGGYNLLRTQFQSTLLQFPQSFLLRDQFRSFLLDHFGFRSRDEGFVCEFAGDARDFLLRPGDLFVEAL